MPAPLASLALAALVHLPTASARQTAPPQGRGDASLATPRPDEATPPPGGPRGLLLTTGLFHADEVPAPDAMPRTGWLGLVANQGDYALTPTPVHAQAAIDPLVDGARGPATGVAVSTTAPAHLVPPEGEALEGTGEALLLLHGLPLRAGGVPSDVQAATPLRPGVRAPLRASEGEARLVVTDQQGFEDPAFGDPRSGLQVLLQRESATGTVRVQELASRAGPPRGSSPQLLWSGDLDGDGHADLLLDLSSDANVRHLALYLSSLAGADELVGLAAELRTVGC